jgi:hypothetical protein
VACQRMSWPIVAVPWVILFAKMLPLAKLETVDAAVEAVLKDAPGIVEVARVNGGAGLDVGEACESHVAGLPFSP